MWCEWRVQLLLFRGWKLHFIFSAFIDWKHKCWKKEETREPWKSQKKKKKMMFKKMSHTKAWIFKTWLRLKLQHWWHASCWKKRQYHPYITFVPLPYITTLYIWMTKTWPNCPAPPPGHTVLLSPKAEERGEVLWCKPDVSEWMFELGTSCFTVHTPPPNSHCKWGSKAAG